MKFSIIIPVFNSEVYLNDCINSILNQDFHDYEIILIDDGSMDKSAEICDLYSNKYGNIKVFHRSNFGQIASRSFGISVASGDYLLFLDSDDMFRNDALSKISEKIEYHSCDMVVFSLERFVDIPIPNFKSEYLDFTIIDSNELFKYIISNEANNSMCLKAIKRELLNFNDFSDFYKIRYGEDLIHTLYVIQSNPKTLFTSEKLYYYRVNPMSLTNNVNIKQLVNDNLFVKNTILRKISNYHSFSKIEIIDYRTLCVLQILGVLSEISVSNTDTKGKINLFKQIKNSDYFVSFLNTFKINFSRLKFKSFIWFLFNLNCFYTIIIIYKIRNFKKILR